MTNQRGKNHLHCTFPLTEILRHIFSLHPDQNNISSRGKNRSRRKKILSVEKCWKLSLLPTRYCPSVQFMNTRWKPCSKHALLVCICVRTMRGTLSEQCSVQFRSEQRRPGQDRASPLVIPAFSGALARTWWAWARKRLRSLVRFSLTVSHSLFYSLLFLTPPDSTSPEATLRMNEFQVFTQQLCLFPVCCTALHRKWQDRLQTVRDYLVTSDQCLQNIFHSLTVCLLDLALVTLDGHPLCSHYVLSFNQVLFFCYFDKFCLHSRDFKRKVK